MCCIAPAATAWTPVAPRWALKQDTDRPITTIASDWGFSCASHFTKHYKQMFDELPSTTLRAGQH
jgi:AraC family transcriptional regulator, ethanolamine operon transcriptional activator